MDQDKVEARKHNVIFTFVGFFILLLNIYYFAHPLFDSMGLSHPAVREYLLYLRDGGMMKNPYITKGVAFVFAFISLISKGGSGRTYNRWFILGVGVFGLLCYVLWPGNGAIYVITSILGYILLSWTIGVIGRGIRGFTPAVNDINETFPQCNDLIETKDSINLPTKYQYKGKIYKGWVNCVNPFRASIVLGTPGSGKSFSIYNPFIEQMVDKGYTMFLYDYKFPDLTKIVFNEYLRKYPAIKNPEYKNDHTLPEFIKDPAAPSFYVINFNDPAYSHRCNPIHARYINDPADSAEIADIVMKNVAPGTVEKEDFFSMSAKVYLDAIVYFLSIYKGGKYCTFPHVIELMGVDYKKVFAVLSGYEELETKIKPFASALEAGAQDQLQGQIASATIPLNKMASPALYWVLSGDDFSLDINNPEDPKFLCIGNDPDRQAIYSTALSLFTSRMFKLINHKKKRKCGVLLDELPTIFIKGLDNLIATARSNKVAIVLGAQDKSQLIRDYSEKEANVIFNTVGNIFAGQVNGRTAEDLNKSLGREYREQQSLTRNIDSESVQTSFHQEELMPISKIETLTQGYFFGKVADNNDTRIERKIFCGEVQRDIKAWVAKEKAFQDIPQLTSFGDEEIRARCHEELISDSIIRTWCANAILSDGIIYDEDEREIRINALIKTLSTKEKEEIIDQEVQLQIKENKDKIIQDNFLRIRQEAHSIIEEELPEDYEDEEEEEDENDNEDPFANM